MIHLLCDSRNPKWFFIWIQNIKLFWFIVSDNYSKVRWDPTIHLDRTCTDFSDSPMFAILFGKIDIHFELIRIIAPLKFYHYLNILFCGWLRSKTMSVVASWFFCPYFMFSGLYKLVLSKLDNFQGSSLDALEFSMMKDDSNHIMNQQSLTIFFCESLSKFRKCMI